MRQTGRPDACVALCAGPGSPASARWPSGPSPPPRFTPIGTVDARVGREVGPINAEIHRPIDELARDPRVEEEGTPYRENEARKPGP